MWKVFSIMCQWTNYHVEDKGSEFVAGITICVCVCVCVGVCVCWVTQSCLTLCNLVNCSPPGSSVHGISQPIVLEWVAIFSSRVSSPPMHWTHIFCCCYIGRWILYDWATWEAQPASQYIMTLEIMYLLWARDLKSGRPVFESCIWSLIPGWSWGDTLILLLILVTSN